MAYTALTYPFGSLLTSTKMTQNQANFTALAEGQSGAPSIQGSAAITTLFGAWTSRTNSTSYVASFDLAVMADVFLLGAGGETISGWTDGSNPPTTQRQIESTVAGDSNRYASIAFNVRKGDFYIVGTDASGGIVDYYILPMGI